MTPTFSRRHYQEIAKVINSIGLSDPNAKIYMSHHFAETLMKDNPRFDTFRFLRACTIVDFKEEK